MTGTGTKANPYVLTTAADWDTLASEGSQGKYCKLGADIDFSGTPYATNFKPLSVKFRSFDGCGHAIRGIYKNAVGSSFSLFEDVTTNAGYANVEIKDLTVEAEIIADKVRLFEYKSSTNIYNISNCCFILNFTGAIPDTGALFNTPTLTLNFTYCTIILNADISEARPLMLNGSIKSSQVRMNTVIRGSDSAVTDNALWQGVTMGDTGFFGGIELRDGGETPGSVLWAHGGHHGNVYQVIEYKNIAESLWNADLVSVCFYDKDRVGSAEVKNAVSNEQDLLIYDLTTAQCTDAAYLRSIGYVCEGEE